MRILLVLVLISSAAHADRRTYTRQPAVPPAKPTAIKSKAQPPPAKPALTAAAILKQVEDNQPIYTEQEAMLEQLVRETPDSEAEKPDLMFRLAEQYAKQWRFWTIEENEKH